MPSLERITNMQDHISAERLRSALDQNEVLVLDFRSQLDYQKGHVIGSMNVNIPPLLQRRLKKGSLSLPTVFSCREMRARFTAECKCKEVVMYDSITCDINANTSNLLYLVYDTLQRDGCRVKVLSGEFSLLLCTSQCQHTVILSSSTAWLPGCLVCA